MCDRFLLFHCICIHGDRFNWGFCLLGSGTNEGPMDGQLSFPCCVVQVCPRRGRAEWSLINLAELTQFGVCEVAGPFATLFDATWHESLNSFDFGFELVTSSLMYEMAAAPYIVRWNVAWILIFRSIFLGLNFHMYARWTML